MLIILCRFLLIESQRRKCQNIETHGLLKMSNAKSLGVVTHIKRQEKINVFPGAVLCDVGHLKTFSTLKYA